MKRSQQDIQKLTHLLHAYIMIKPGLTIKELSKDLNVSVKNLTLPIKKLQVAKSIRAKNAKKVGREDNTTYFPVIMEE